MSFHEVQFPPSISYGSRGGPGHNTAVVELDSGAEERIVRWTDPRRGYDVGLGVKSYADLAAIVAFAIARQGAAHGFRFKDWSDYTTNADGQTAATANDVYLGTGDGATTVFQLVKTYSSGGTTRTRRIEKPVTGTTKIAINTVDTAGVGWTVNTTTGQVTFSVAPTIGQTVSGGCEFDVPTRFGGSVDELLAVSMDDFASGSIPEVSVVEIKNETPIDEDFFFGGAQTFDPFSANVAITPNDGRLLLFNPTTGGLVVNLPDPSAYSTGGPYFFIGNLTGTTFDVKYSGTTIITVPATTAVTIVLGLDAGGAKTWYGF